MESVIVKSPRDCRIEIGNLNKRKNELLLKACNASPNEYVSLMHEIKAIETNTKQLRYILNRHMI